MVKTYRKENKQSVMHPKIDLLPVSFHYIMLQMIRPNSFTSLALKMMVFHYINSRVNFRELFLYRIISDQSSLSLPRRFIHCPAVWTLAWRVPALPRTRPSLQLQFGSEIKETTCEVLHEDHLLNSWIK